MLTCKVGKNIINTFEFENEQIRTWSHKGILKCPVCRSGMIYKNGEIKIAHFAHEKAASCLDIYSESETEEHLNGKKIIYEWLKTQTDIINLKLESWIPETKQRPDIYFECNGKRFVIEFQCSPIATEFIQRRRLYELAGIKDIWILGRNKYNITINEKGKISHSNRFKEIENHTSIYLDTTNKSVIIPNGIIQGYLKHKAIKLERYYSYSINDTQFDISKLQISPKDIILDKFIKDDYEKYLTVKDAWVAQAENDRKEKLEEERLSKLKEKIKSECCNLANALNNKYKNVNKECKFCAQVGNYNYYLWKIEFTSKFNDLTFFIKENKIDCCTEYIYNKTYYTGGRGRNGGASRRTYQATGYHQVLSLEYDNLNIDTIKEFICKEVSDRLRKYKYNIR